MYMEDGQGEIDVSGTRSADDAYSTSTARSGASPDRLERIVIT